MFARFLGRFFWNFYDYLGTHLLLGTLAILLGLAPIYGATLVLRAPLPVSLSLLILGLVIAVETAVVSAVSAGFGAFATRAARDEAARLVHFKAGAAGLFAPYLKLALLAALAAAVVAANIMFYGGLARAAESMPAKIGFVSLAMLFAWGGLALLIYAFVAFAAPARYGREVTLREALHRAVVLFFLMPGTWLGVTVFVIFVSAVLAVSIVGMVFLWPVLATASTTAFHLAAEHAQHLAKAREEMGAGHPVWAYRRRAAELAEEADARRPRRTLRELIRPWEA